MDDNMRIVRVKNSGEYDVNIGKGILSQCGKIIKSVKRACRAVIITDSNVEKLYLNKVKTSLEKEGFECISFSFPAGEKSKSAKTFIDILNFLAFNNITRSDLLVALGGGVVGDIVGFSAACYLRGIDFVQIPTTLLAAVDSSVGGKTAIDLDAGKNLAGAFYQPISVVCDTDTFETLPEREVACGYAEVIKYAVLFDGEFFSYLSEKECEIENTVEKCVIFKRDIVCKDEFDRGERQLLNLGHTTAHGIEKASGYSVTHGEAVAIGMVIAEKISKNIGVLKEDFNDKLLAILKQYNLPTKCEYGAQDIFKAALSDKKRNGKTISLVLPEKIGKCVLYEADVENLAEIFENAIL